MKKKAFLICAGLVLTLSLTSCEEFGAFLDTFEPNTNPGHSEVIPDESYNGDEATSGDIDPEAEEVVENTVHSHVWSTEWNQNSETHWKVCTTCGKIDYRSGHDLVYTILGDSKHEERCKTCSYVAEIDHTIEYEVLDVSNQHQRKCDVCGYRDTAESHSLTMVNEGEDMHHTECTVCSYVSASEEHKLTYKSVNDQYHTVACEECSYSVDIVHTLEYESLGDNNHEITCEDCNYDVIEDHRLEYYDDDEDNESGLYHHAECLICSYKGEQEEHHYGYHKSDAYWHNITCNECAKSKRSEGHDLVYTPIDANYHQVYCTICDYEEPEVSHIFFYTTEGPDTHHYTCSTCGYESGSVPHDFNYTNLGEVYHSAECPCGEVKSAEGHTLEYTDTGDDTCHVVNCTYCSYSMEVAHDYSYTMLSAGSDGYHEATCSICGHHIEEQHTLGYESDDDTNHHEVCTLCSYASTELLPHEYDFVSASSTSHVEVCKYCEHETEPVDHILAYTDNNDGTHHEECDICGYDADVTHTLEYESVDDDVHAEECIYCRYAESAAPHEKYISITDENSHTTMCYGCDYAKVEDHTNAGATDGNCDVCKFSAGLSYSSGTVSGKGSYTGTVLGIPNKYNGAASSVIGSNAFYSNNIYTEIIIPASVVTINSQAFDNCQYLTTLTFETGSNLTSINSYAFRYCYVLESVSIPETVTTLGGWAFYYCYELKTLNFGENPHVTSMGQSTFCYCCALEEVTIPNTLTSMGTYCFDSYYSSTNGNTGETTVYDSSLETVVFEEGCQLTSIPNYAFYGCTHLSSINLEACTKITSVGNSAFCNCYEIPYIHLSPTVTTLGTWSFYNCVSAESITFGEDSQLTILPRAAFCSDYNSRSAVKSITVPKGVTTIDQDCFYGSTEMETLTFESGSVLTNIGYRAFYNCTSLKSVVIPATVKTIGERAFRNCTGLETVVFEPDSQLESIDQYAFYYCTSLTSLIIPASVSYIAGGDTDDDGNTKTGAFAYCTSLGSVVFEDDSQFSDWSRLESIFNKDTIDLDLRNTGITEIESGMFQDSSIRSIRLPATVTSIGANAFNGASNLENVVFASGSQLESIGANAFSNTPSLKEFTVPASVTSIGSQAFCYSHSSSYECYLETLTFEEGSQLTTVGDDAFRGCENLATMNLEACTSLTSIGSYSFADPHLLDHITIPASLTSFGNRAFTYCYGAKTITFEEGSPLTSISDYAFRDCNSVTDITLPIGVTSIGSYSFADCYDLVNVNFDQCEKLSEFDTYAFRYCYSLEEIRFVSAITSVDNYAFQDATSLKYLLFTNNGSTSCNLKANCFNGCSALEALVLPSSLSWGTLNIGTGQFSSCPSTCIVYLCASSTSSAVANSNRGLSKCTMYTSSNWAWGDDGYPYVL